MDAITRKPSALALSAALLVGCGTAYVPMDNWTYSGTDEATRAPARIPRGNLSDSAWLDALSESKARWFHEREEIIERAKDNCARDTGASKTPGYWMGYSSSFKACMEARGWSVGRSPL